MYKITLNGIQVETENASEVRSLIFGNSESGNIDKASIPNKTKRYEKSPSRYTKTKTMIKWLPEEVKYITDNIAFGGGTLKKSNVLLQRHTPSGIGYMIYRIKKGGKRFTDDIQPLVDEYHSRKDGF